MCARILSSIGGRLRESFILLVCLFPLFILTHSASAISIPLTVWNFSGNTGSEPTSPSTPTAGFQATLITRSVSGSPAALADGFAANGWPFPGSGTNAYFEFSINPQAGTTYTITDIFLELVSTPGEGPGAWELRSDADGFAMNLDPLIPPSGPHDSLLVGSGFLNLTGPRTFRLYGINSSGGLGGLTRLDINGTFTSSAVPETLPFGAFGLTVTLLLFARSRIKE